MNTRANAVQPVDYRSAGVVDTPAAVMNLCSAPIATNVLRTTTAADIQAAVMTRLAAIATNATSTGTAVNAVMYAMAAMAA